MITTITSFPIPTNLSEETARAHFTEVAHKFQDVPGLVRKQFLYSRENNTAGGVYLWESREAADQFIKAKLLTMIKTQFGVEASVQYFSTPVVVDNHNQTIFVNDTYQTTD